jgi:hypothetical protein
MATTMIPMPPNHWSIERQTSTPSGSVSSPVNTVEPVVVMPDIASNMASVRLAWGGPSMNGIAPNTGSATQTLVVRRKVCWSVMRSRPRVRAGQREEPAEQRRDDARLEEDRPVAVPGHQVEDQRKGHRHPERRDEEADHVSDGAQVDHRGGALAAAAALSSAAGETMGRTERVARGRGRVRPKDRREASGDTASRRPHPPRPPRRDRRAGGASRVATWTSATKQPSPDRPACQARQPKSSVPSPRPWWLSMTVIATSAAPGAPATGHTAQAPRARAGRNAGRARRSPRCRPRRRGRTGRRRTGAASRAGSGTGGTGPTAGRTPAGPAARPRVAPRAGARAFRREAWRAFGNPGHAQPPAPSLGRGPARQPVGQPTWKSVANSAGRGCRSRRSALRSAR